MQFDQLKRREFITPLCCCAAVTGPLSARAQTADGDAGDRLSTNNASATLRSPFRPRSISCLGIHHNWNALLRRRVMSAYHVSFFKNLLSSDGHPFKCLQRRIDVSDAESTAQAAESASRAFEALYGCPWKLHADSIEIIAADPQ